MSEENGEQPTEPTPEDQAILEEAARIVTGASDKLDMEGLYGILTRLGITITLWRHAMRTVENPMPENWIDEAAMCVWTKFFPHE